MSLESLMGMNLAANPTRLALADVVRDGLPLTALDRLANVVAPGDARFKFRLVSKATLERRVRSTKRLTGDEGDRVVRLAKVFSAGMDVFHDEGKVRTFLGRPHMMLDDRTPLDVALANGVGTDAVLNLLGRVAYGAAV